MSTRGLLVPGLLTSSIDGTPVVLGSAVASDAGDVTSLDVTLPNAEVGVMHVVAVASRANDTLSAPAGWTAAGAANSTTFSQMAVFYRKFQSGDDTTPTFSTDTSGRLKVVAVSVSSAGETVEMATPNTYASVADHTLPTAGLVIPPDPFVLIGFAAGRNNPGLSSSVGADWVTLTEATVVTPFLGAWYLPSGGGALDSTITHASNNYGVTQTALVH